MTTPHKVAQQMAGADARKADDSVDIVQYSLHGVQDQARVQQVARHSPSKVYAGVKSKVAGNMKSIKKSQTRTMVKKTHLEQAQGNSEVSTRRAKTAYYSPKKARKSVQPTYHDKIISEIKSKYSKDAINEMTQEQLATEILQMQGHSSKRNGGVQQQTGEFGVASESKAAYGLTDDVRTAEVDDVEDERHDRAEQMLSSSYVEKQPKNYFPNKSVSAQILSDSFRKKSPMRMSQSTLYKDIQMTAMTQQALRSPNRRLRSPKRSIASPGRRGSPGRKGEHQEYTLDPEVNRAIARELYVNSTVNVVNPSSRKSPSKVKPGQMNLFNPKGQNIEASVRYEITETKDGSSVLNMSPTRTTNSSIANIQGIFRDEGGQAEIRNVDLRKKTEEVQKEFEQIMNEMVARRTGGPGSNATMPRVDDILDGYYMPGPERKHKSPTKRLIKHKDSTWTHKKRIQQGIRKGDYSQTYCISPGKTYVIEPEGGELPYELAEKSPTKFYSQVLHQNIKKYNVKMRGRLTFQWTQRPLLRILSTIKTKFLEEIGEKIGKQFSADIEEAMAPGTDIDARIKEMIADQEIDLEDQQNKELILGQQFSHLSNKYYKADGDALMDDGPANIRIDSPDPHRLQDAKLKIGEKQKSEIQDNVISYVRKNSLIRGAAEIPDGNF